MDKKSILIKIINLQTSPIDALKIKLRYGIELIKFLKLLENNIIRFKNKFYSKIYYNEKKIFLKNINNKLYNKINDDLFQIELIIVSYNGYDVDEIVNVIKNSNQVIIYDIN